MAEGVFRHLAYRRGLVDRFEVESAGTVCYQAGSCPDPRAVRAAGRHGIDISGIRARCIHDLDLAGYDRVFVMDHENYRDVLDALDGGTATSVHMMTGFAEEVADSEIEDPYYGPEEGFDGTLQILAGCAEGILHHLLESYGIGTDRQVSENRVFDSHQRSGHGSAQ